MFGVMKRIMLTLAVITALTCACSRTPEAVQLWEGGRFWATKNVGSEYPEAFGECFSWGEISTKDIYNWETYDSSAEPVFEMGGGWRVPSEAEWSELIERCTWTWTELRGVAGYEVAGPLGSIFLPAGGYHSGNRMRYSGDAGFYWSSTCVDSTYARELYFHSDYHGFYSSGRDCGRSIRLVRDSQ